MSNTVTPPEGAQRVLATVVFTDVVNYSGRMAQDEALTMRLVQRDLQWMRDVCTFRGGQVVKNTGDGLLLFFSSAQAALHFGLDVQKGLQEMAASWSDDETLQHRLGLHLGDVFVTGDDLLGETVNLAARLMAEAEPNSIAFSTVVHEMVKSSLPYPAVFLGEKSLKHIPRPVPVYLLRSSYSQMAIPPAQSEEQKDVLRAKVATLAEQASNLRVTSMIKLRVAPAPNQPKISVQKLQDGRISYKGPYLTMHREVMNAVEDAGCVASTTDPAAYTFDLLVRGLLGPSKVPVKFYSSGLTMLVDFGNPAEFPDHKDNVKEAIRAIQERLLSTQHILEPGDTSPQNPQSKLRPPSLPTQRLK